MESRTPIVCTLDARAPCHRRSHGGLPPGVPLVMSRRRIELWAALWVVYLVWGSTYLGIKLAVRTLPPLLTAGTRFLAAAVVLAGILTVARRSLRASRREV